MKYRTRFVLIFTVLLGMLLACGPLTRVTSPGSNSNSGSGITSTPQTPNPLNVQITLDTANAQTSFGYTGFLGMPGADGTYPFQLTFPVEMASVEADGSLMPATRVPVTITPVSAIDGVPFSQGYLKAVDLSPQGLLMITPAILKLTLPGEYDPTTLVGFSSDGNGNNFHLYPATIDVVPLSGGYGGFTEVTFDILHFSVYGVAQATAQEITAQHARVPESQTAQDEDLLAPLPPQSPRNAARENAIWDELARQHRDRIQPRINLVPTMEDNCNYVDVTAQEFINWHAHVERANAVDHFRNEISADSAVLLAMLIKCAAPDCNLCMQDPPGPSQNANSFMIHAYYAERIANISGSYDEVRSFGDLAQQCAVNAGLEQPAPPVAMGEFLGGADPTPIPCPPLEQP
jgi:hypothetical protein